MGSWYNIHLIKVIDNNVSSIVDKNDRMSIVYVVDDLGTPCDEVDYTADLLYWGGGSLGWDRCCPSVLNELNRFRCLARSGCV